MRLQALNTILRAAVESFPPENPMIQRELEFSDKASAVTSIALSSGSSFKAR